MPSNWGILIFFKQSIRSCGAVFAHAWHSNASSRRSPQAQYQIIGVAWLATTMASPEKVTPRVILSFFRCAPLLFWLTIIILLHDAYQRWWHCDSGTFRYLYLEPTRFPKRDPVKAENSNQLFYLIKIQVFKKTGSSSSQSWVYMRSITLIIPFLPLSWTKPH